MGDAQTESDALHHDALHHDAEDGQKHTLAGQHLPWGRSATDTPAPGGALRGLDTLLAPRLGGGLPWRLGARARGADRPCGQAQMATGPRLRLSAWGEELRFTPSGLQRFKFILIYIYKNKTGSLSKVQIIQKWIMHQVKVSGILLPQDKQSDSLGQTLPGYIFYTYKNTGPQLISTNIVT